MSYTAKSLEDIAAAFDHRAWQATAFSDRLHKTKRDKLLAERESRTWKAAAQMLRETKLPALDTVIAAAESYSEDLSTGLADGTYEEGADELEALEAALATLKG